MIRTTKALARLGTLAVVAGAAISAPFAAGVANAAPTITVGVVGPTAIVGGGGTVVTAAQASARTDVAASHEVVTPNLGTITGAFTVSLIGSSAYFANPLPAGYTGSNNQQTVTCAAGGCGPLNVDDNVGEAAALGISDSVGNTGTATVKFNTIYYTVSAQECPTNDIDTLANCVTQGSVGTAIPVTVHYAAGQSGASDTDGAFRQLVVSVRNTTVETGGRGFAPFGPVIVGGVAGAPNTITCTTDANGDCKLQIVDSNPADWSGGANGADFITAAIAQTATPNYPAVGTIVNSGTVLAQYAIAPGPQATLNITSGSVATTRIDLISAQSIAPDAQDAAAGSAEPGDAVQLKYQVTGSCTPAAFATCTGLPLAGVSVPLSVDHGFFTPNCEQTQSDDPTKLLLNFYGQCSFTTAPAAGGQVGNLTNSGATKSVVTNTAGQFVVTIGIGRDTAFDNAGTVVAHVTSGTVGATIGGDTRAPGVACTPSGSDNVTSPTTAAGLTGLTDGGGCAADIQWTTQEVPLNGGTAKYSIIKALAQPNNVSIDTENNFGDPNVTDTATSNVPDTARVVFEVKATDQFGNLVQFTTGRAASRILLTKTGPGGVGKCKTSTTTDACGDGTFGNQAAKAGSATCTPQADGTTKETDTAVQGTYLNLPTGAGAPGNPDVRYQADVDSQNCSSFNDGYSTTQPGALDGTQTDVLSWTAPTTTFSALTAGVWSYAAGNAAAATDTLTLNFYNQLAQPVVTFTVTPGNKVPTSTAVTVTAKEVDQFGNPIVGSNIGTTSGTNGGVGVITAVRSGQNEASCVPTQGTVNGGAVPVLFTNTSGVAGYTFSCNAPGVSTVSMVVTGPGGTQLAAGKEAITFTGAGVHRTVERPTVSLTSFHKHHLTVNVHTDPALGAGRTVDIYRLINGVKHMVGQTHTGPRGNATLTFHGLRSGRHWRVAAKVVGLGTQYRSEYSVAVSHRIK